MIRVTREVFDLDGTRTAYDRLPMYGEGNPLRPEIVSCLEIPRVERVTLHYSDHRKVYTLVNPTKGTTEGSDLPSVDDQNPSAAKRWLERALVRVCTEICRRGMGSQVIP